ncbi:MAG: YIP1 family protein [Limisphaerales bacterium]
MLRALNLSISPEAEWQKAALKPPHLAFVLLLSILPLMIATLAVEGYALTKYGEMFGDIGRRSVSQERAIKYAVFYGVSSLAVIFIGAGLLKNVGESFNLRVPYGTYFVLMAFAYSPVFFGRLLDAVPAINTWICWAVGVGLSMRILYHGVAWWLKPEQTKGFGLFLLSFIYILVLSGLVHFASIQVLQGKFLKNVLEPTDRQGLELPAKS